MKTEAAMAHLAAYREGKVTDPLVSKALRCIENDSVQRGLLAEQVAFDLRVLEMLGAIRTPEDLRQRLQAAQPEGAKTSARPRHHLTAVFAVGLGTAIIIAVLIFLHLQNVENFPGRDSLVRIASSAKNMSGAELEPVANPAGDLGDWFYMRGFEGYRLPPELRRAPAVGSHFFKQEGHPVAQVAIDPHQSLLYVVRGDDFGIVLPNGEDWTIFPAQDWIVAARSFESFVAMVSFRGTEREMREFLTTLKP